MALSSKNIYLIGFMGTGKTVVGQLLARKLDRSFVDLDQFIETQTGMTVSNIIDDQGEAHFRRLEQEALDSVAQRRELVVATGGGTVLDSRNRAVMQKNGWVIALTADLDTLERRLEGGAGRPLIRRAKADGSTLEKIHQQRLPFYQEADLIIDTSLISPEEVVDRIGRHV